MAMVATFPFQPGFETIHRLGSRVMRLLAPEPITGAAPDVEVAARAILARLHEIDEVRRELARTEMDLKAFFTDPPEQALAPDRRDEMLGLAERLTSFSNSLSHSPLSPLGPFGQVAAGVIEAYNAQLRAAQMAAAEASSRLVRIVADEEQDDADALAAVRSLPREDEIVEWPLPNRR
jgi:hypothetical protein